MASSKPLNWEPTTGPFEVRYRAKGDTDYILYPDNPVASPPIIITDLLENVTYEWQVRSDCGGGEFSPWINGPDFTVGYECRAPTLAEAIINNTDLFLGSRIRFNWRDTASGVFPLNPDPDVKIFIKLRSASTYTEITTGGMPKYSDGTYLSEYIDVPGNYDWYLEVQCDSGARPTSTGDSVVIPSNLCDPVPPSSISYVDAVDPANDYFEWPPVPDALNYDAQILQVVDGQRTLLTSFNTTDPDTNSWQPNSNDVDPADLVVTYLGDGCPLSPSEIPPYHDNSRFIVEYKPGGVLTVIPEGILISIKFRSSASPETVEYETPYQIAPGDATTLSFCVITFNPIVHPTGFLYNGGAFNPSRGFMPGNTYVIRVRSRCAVRISAWSEFTYYIPAVGCPVTIHETSLKPKDFSSVQYDSRPGYPNNSVFLSFRVDRPSAGASTWTDVVIATYAPGSKCIPSSEVVLNLFGPIIKIQPDGDILLTTAWYSGSAGALYINTVFQLP